MPPFTTTKTTMPTFTTTKTTMPPFTTTTTTMPPTKECVTKTSQLDCPNNKNVYTQVTDCNGIPIASDFEINCIYNVGDVGA